MDILGFTADASLYRNNGHYRTGRNTQAIHLPAGMIETIHPARDEVIEVHDCAVGSHVVNYDDGTWGCKPDSWGGGGGIPPGSPGGGDRDRDQENHRSDRSRSRRRRCRSHLNRERAWPAMRYCSILAPATAIVLSMGSTKKLTRRHGTVATAICASVAGKRVNGKHNGPQAEDCTSSVRMDHSCNSLPRSHNVVYLD